MYLFVFSPIAGKYGPEKTRHLDIFHTVSINGYSSGLHFIRCDVPQQILGSILFLVYITDLHYAIKHCQVRHFAGDTNLSNFSHSIKDEQKGSL